MPNSENVVIKAFFTADAIPLEAATISGSGDVSYQVSTTGRDGEYQTACSSKVGDWVKVVAKPSYEGFVVTEDAILVTDRATGKPIKLVKPTGSDHFAFQMPSQGVDIYVFFVGNEHTLKLRTVNADGTEELQGKSLWQIEVNGNWPVVENNADGSDTKACSYDEIVLSLTQVGATKYYIDKVELKTEGGEYAGGIQYVGDEYYFYMPDADTTCTVYLKAQATDDVYLGYSLSYDSTRGTASFEKGGTAISSCKAGDTVMVRATAAEGFTFGPDDITITRADGGELTKGSDENAGNFVPVYEDKDGMAVLTGWKFVMPKGGVNVVINFSPIGSNGIELTIKDQNGNDLKGSGFVSVQYDGNYFTDLSADLGKVSYGSAVTVSLTDVGSSSYYLTKVTVEGVTCYDNDGYYGFYMPNTTAKIEVTLTEISAEPTSYKLYSSYDYNKGTVGFYIGGNPVDSAAEGETVDIVFTPTAGYMLDSYTIVRNTDNVTVAEETGLAESGSKTVNVTIGDPSSGADFVKDDITVTANFVNRTYKATIKIVDSEGTEITDENLVQFKGADGKYKAVKNGSEVEVVYNNTVNIGLTSTGSTYKIAKYTVTDTNGLAVPKDCNRSEFSYKVTKDGVTEIYIALQAK